MDAAGGRLRVLVVDDEAPAREELGFLLSRDELVGEVLVAAGAQEALRHLGAGDVDVVLSDVHMPGLDGLDLARAVSRLAFPPAVVFVTAHEEHAVEAFELQVVDYVLKPVRAARLAAALRRATAAPHPSVPHPTVPRPAVPGGSAGAAPGPGGAPELGRSAGAGRRAGDETLSVELGGVTRFVQRSSVLWAEAQGDYVRLHTADGSHLLRSTLSQLEERWAPAGFVRTHRSLLVAVGAVTELRSDDGHHTLVVAAGGVRRELPVARRHAREVRERLVEAAVGRAPGPPPGLPGPRP
ncbi:LytR/AlgR family response regulator transcription factor [Aquipuribacter hungaricus]|uniref:LytR/AlgR family response regulator transcription factor n=2 Tax=Aquipuribacter hungaricus TaxID=545624 RepID=A0ABV7WKE0_9MICO